MATATTALLFIPKCVPGFSVPGLHQPRFSWLCTSPRMFLTGAVWLRAGGCGFAPQTFPTAASTGTGCGMGSPPDPSVPSQNHRAAWAGRAFKGQLVQLSFFSTTCSFPSQITALGKAMQPLGRSETAARTWQHRAHSGVKFIEEKAIALGKKCPKCL